MSKQQFIYVAFVRSNTKAGKIIRKLTGWKYSHVSIALDKAFDKFYAFSRLNYQSSFIAGFTEEYKSNYTLLKETPAEITYYKIPITLNEKNKIMSFLDELSKDKEYIFNYPSMFTTTIIHGFEIYKSYNCITFVSKILSFISSVKLNKKYYKYDLNELENDVKEFYYKKEKFTINKSENTNAFFNDMSYFERKKAELKLLSECFYRLLFKKSSKRYNSKIYEEKIKKQSIKTFNFLSKKYDTSLSGYNPRKNYKLIIDKIKLGKNDVLLDVGCGTGEILNTLANKYKSAKLYGLDISPEMINVAKRKNKSKKINYICGDSEKIPFEDNTFDILITSESFHHYPNSREVLKEFKRVIKPNGKLILCDMYRPIIIRNFMNFMFNFTKTGDVKIYTKNEIFNLLKDYNYKDITWEKYYSSFICEATNDKKN